VVRLYFLGPQNSVKCGPHALSGGPMLHDSPPVELPSTWTASRSRLHKVAKGHTLWHIYTANNVKTAI